jgi:3-oxoadipate enol-lactonase
MPTIGINDESIFYREFGDAEKVPLFLLHGLYSDSSTLEALGPELTPRFHVIAPDMLGHGRSSRPTEFSLADQGRALNSLIEALGYESAVVLGISMGSYIAAQAAILEPARTAKLVLVVPKAHGTTSSVAAYAARMGIDLRTAKPEDLLMLMAEALWSPATSQARRDEITASTEDQILLTVEERAAVERSLAGFDLRPHLPSITAPTLVISGRADGLNPPEAGEELAKLIPDARFEVYERSGHMLTAEQTDELVGDITTFVLGTAEGT